MLRKKTIVLSSSMFNALPAPPSLLPFLPCPSSSLTTLPTEAHRLFRYAAVSLQCVSHSVRHTCVLSPVVLCPQSSPPIPYISPGFPFLCVLKNKLDFMAEIILCKFFYYVRLCLFSTHCYLWCLAINFKQNFLSRFYYQDHAQRICCSFSFSWHFLPPARAT